MELPLDDGVCDSVVLIDELIVDVSELVPDDDPVVDGDDVLVELGVLEAVDVSDVDAVEVTVELWLVVSVVDIVLLCVVV